jgi:hypothetical protein
MGVNVRGHHESVQSGSLLASGQRHVQAELDQQVHQAGFAREGLAEVTALLAAVQALQQVCQPLPLAVFLEQ